MNNKTKFLKFSIAVILGASAAGLIYAELTIPTNIENSVMTIKQINITQSGQETTPKIVIDGSATDNNFLKVEGNIVMGTIAGASTNKVSGNKSNVLGGQLNNITNSNFSVIAGGDNNKINANYGFVAGGQNNTVNGLYGFAGGKNAVSNAGGTFVWADDNNTKFTGSVANSFVIRANGGVGINTATPTAGYKLDVLGSGIVQGNLVANNLIAGAYYYGSALPGDALYELGLTPRQDGAVADDIYYSSGDVGIGINNPTANLHVVGTVKLQGPVDDSTQSTALMIASDGTVSTRALNNAAFVGVTETDPIWTAEKSQYINTGPTTQTKSGNLSVVRLISTQSAGTSPFQVTSNTVVTNLNSDLLDGQTSTYFLDTSTDEQTKKGNLNIDGNLNVKGNLIVDTVVNRKVTDISVSGGIMPQEELPSTYKRLGTSSNKWNELFVTNINAELSTDTTSSTTVVVKDSSNNFKTRTLNPIAFNGYAAPVTSVAGKVGVVTLVKSDVGLSNVDNTTDLAKPISTATQTALNTKAPLASPALTGVPTAPTAASSTNNTQIATTAFVKAQSYLTSFSESDPLSVKLVGDQIVAGVKTFSNRIRLVNSTTELYNESSRLKVKAESTDNVAQFASYGLYLPSPATSVYNLYMGGGMQIGYSQTNPVLSYANGDLLFSSASTERMRLTAAGNLGIGTSPVSKLHVFGPSPVITLEGYVDDITKINFIDDGSVVGELSVNRDIGITKLWTVNPLSFGANNQEGMRILGNGNVGIGTASPGARLEVKQVNPQTSPQTAIKIGGPNTPADVRSAQDIQFGFSSAGSSRIRSYRGSSRDTYLQFLVNNITAGSDNPSVAMHINHDGNVGIGTITPSNKLHVAGAIGATDWIGAGCEGSCESAGGYAIMYPNGTIVATSSVTAQAFYYSSDITLKKDLTKITNPLQKIVALNGYNFTWKSDDTKDIGVVAQEVEKVFPDAVKADAKGLKSVKYGNLVAPIIEAIKELYTKYLDQQDAISKLEQRIEALEKNSK